MKKALVVLMILFCTQEYVLAKSKDVLLIHSYHRGYKWSDDISKVIESRFERSENTTLTTVYMDTKKVASQKYFSSLFKLYREQFKNRNFDLIMVADNNALEFIMRYYSRLFQGVPVVFLGINNFDEAMESEKNVRKYMTGVVEQVDIKKNIDLILKMQPDLKRIVIINDRSKTGFAMKQDIFQVLPQYKGRVEFEYIDNIDIDNLKINMQKLTNNTAILWVLLFKDKTGKQFTHKESLHQIRKIANVPIYGLWDFYVGEGIVGGQLTSATAQARAATDMAQDILKGAKPANVPILKRSPNAYMFDYNELKQYNLKIPDDIFRYSMVNKPFSFYEEYKVLVWISISIFSIIVVILVFLAINIAQRRKSEMALTNQLKFIEVLMDTIPNPINYKNLNGQYVGCNRAFADMFGKTKEQIRGKTVFDFFPKDWAKEQTQKDRDLLQKKGSDNFERTLHFQNGKTRVLSYNKTVYSHIDGSVGGIVSVMDDITERIQQKQFLIQQSKLAEMGEMVAAIAHQWNEPLVEVSAILQDMEFSYKQAQMSDKKMRDFVNESMIQIQYMSQTLKDFRNFLKPSTQKNIFCAKAALDDVLEIIGRQIFYAHINIHLTCKDDKVTVYGYENEFKQVLLNIINNAKNAIMKSKHGKNIYIDIKTENSESVIKISNDGDIIPEDIIKFIFDPYFTTSEDGTGLGLYMAKIIIEDKMQGKVRVYNYVNQVFFTIHVPSAPI